MSPEPITMRNGSPTRGAAAGARPDGSARQGLSLLVAEDSPVIRRVFQVHLEDSPHTLTFATDGREALQLFRARRFDVVLMDIQMPVMDGLVATRAIRAFECEEAHIPIPIVACTASARPEDIGASRLAGCNDYLQKPFGKHALFQVLDRVTNGGDSEPGNVENGVPSSIEIDVPTRLKSFAPAYLEARRRDVTAATVLLATGDFDQLGQMAHKMAGSGGLYGFQGLTELGARLEASALAADRAGIEEHLQALRVYLTTVRLPPGSAMPTISR
jgi:CheY-like chemotaxis protein